MGQDFYQKKSRVRNFSARTSGAGNGSANFMGAWHFLVLSAGKTPMPIKFREILVAFPSDLMWSLACVV